MNYGQYSTSRKRAAQLLAELECLRKEHLRFYPIPQQYLKDARRGDHSIIYDSALDHQQYDFLLKDGAIFQFDFADSGSNANARFAYYQFPYEFVTYEDFLFGLGSSYEKEGEAPREMYEQELAEADKVQNPISFRYDLAYNSYVQCVHGASHIHFGTKNSIRVPVNRVLTPYAFVVFVLRNVYYETWKSFSTKGTFHSAIASVKKSSTLLPASFFSEIDGSDLHLT